MKPLVLLLSLSFSLLSLQPGFLLAQEVTPEVPVEIETLTPTDEPGDEPTPENTPEATVEPTLDITAEPTVEATAEATTVPTSEVTAEPTVESTTEPPLEPNAPPVFNLEQTAFDAVSGQKLEIILSVSDETGVVRVVEDISATLGGLTVASTPPSESSAPYNTGVTVTYLAPADFSGADTFSLSAIDAAGESASVTISVNVEEVEATAEVMPEITVIPEDGLMVATTFTVNSNNDVDDGVCNATHCSLREAINASNNSEGEKDTIAFNIGTGVQTIQPTSPLPEIIDPVIIDGTTQPGYAGQPIIVLNGANVDDFYPEEDQVGLNLGEGVTLRGFVVNGFDYAGIRTIPFGSGNVVENCYIGTDVTGNNPVPNRYGVLITLGTFENVIGGTTAAARNVISGNTDDGIYIYQSSYNTIQGNYIGVNVTGDSNLGNGGSGITSEESDDIVIGGTTPGARNIISGNANNGIHILGDGFVGYHPPIQGNYIGTDVTGTTAIGNGLGGVVIENSIDNTIGGTEEGTGNVISGNLGQANVYITGINAMSNRVLGNFIGTNADGTAVIGGLDESGCTGMWTCAGVEVRDGASQNYIGGAYSPARNIISGNPGNGINIWNASDTIIMSNYIGVGVDGATAIPNLNGVGLIDSNRAIVSDGEPGHRSVISRNENAGVVVNASGLGFRNSIGGNEITYNGGAGVFLIGSEADSQYPDRIGIGDNQIFGNGGLGIDLGSTQEGMPDGVTPNDPLDGDTGPNNFQNYPVLTSVLTDGTEIMINGTLNSAASTTYRVQVFANDTCDSSGYGEGQTYLGFADVTTDGSGDAAIDIILDVSVAVGQQITATAVDPNRNTSEFSPCVQVVVPQTFVVTSNNDVDDGVCDATHCSLREAINASNLSIGVKDTIAFSIGTGVQTIQPTSPLPTITDPVIIDGTTQPGFAGTPIIGLDGVNAGASTSTHGLSITAGDSLVRGLAIFGFSGDGIYISGNGGNTIQGNYLGTNYAGTGANVNREGIRILSANNLVGGTTASARNLISGNFLSGVYINGAAATGNQIQGNYIGTNAAGTASLANGSSGISIGNANGNFIGGTEAGARNVISGNSQYGVSLSNAADANEIQGNYIGTNAAGTAALTNQRVGVNIDVSQNNLIGGTDAAARNIISGNTQNGVVIESENDLPGGGNRVEGNYIGLNAAGTGNIPNGHNGVLVDSGVDNNVIGGSIAGAGNRIAGNTLDGIRITSDTADGNMFLGNSIYGNTNLGINIGNDNVTFNDAGDIDDGPNDRQNFPVLTTALSNFTTIDISGTLNSTVATPFRVEFFANTTCDNSSYGEGQTYLGFADVVTDGSGNATFTANLDAIVTVGTFITATATNTSSGTSEFSACITTINPNGLAVNTTSDADDGVCNLTHCSLREAIDVANTVPGVQTITFNISGAGTRTILLGSMLVLDDSVIIDGRTQPGYDNFISGVDLRPANGSVVTAFHLRGGGGTYNPDFSASIYGLGINRFSSYAVNIANGTDHLIEENYIGVDPVTLFGVPGLEAGILVNTPNNVIFNNFIALAFGNGISLESDAADDNLILANLLLVNNNGISISGGASNNIVQANLISGNDQDGVYIAGPSSGNSVIGNSIGADIDGLTEYSNGRAGVYIYNSNGNIIGGTEGVTPSTGCDGNCNLISGNVVGVQVVQSDNTQILGNYIGTTVAGTASIPNIQVGIVVFNSNNTIIGGASTNARNLISGNYDGIKIDDSNGTQIQGNYIGLRRDGTTGLANTRMGIFVVRGDDTLIGGTSAGAGNRIAFNGEDGVRVENGTGNSILGNWIFSNSRLGIELGALGVSPNDPGDADTGPNNMQNFPVLNLALNAAGTLEISGSLNSLPNATYRVEFFANTTCDSSQNGEGQTYLGFSDVTTGATGNGIISASFPLPAEQIITATATDADNSTSEFSACRPISLAKPVTKAPTLIAPAKNSFTNDVTPSFNWNTALNAVNYEIQVSSTSNFAVLEFTANSPATVQTPTTSLIDGVHYWRVRGSNSLGSGPWSATFAFTVDTVAPDDAPGLIRPTDGSPTNDTTPVFAWQRYAGAKHYRLNLSTSPDPNCGTDVILTSPILTRTSFAVPNANALTMEDTYFWCVRADDAAGNWGPYSDAINFQLTLLKTPLNGSSTTDTTPTFSWNKAPGTGVTYDLLVSINPDLSAPVINVTGLTTTRFTPDKTAPLPSGVTYYWRVIVNGGTWQVEDEVIWAFLLNPIKLAAPTITAPANRSFTFDVSPDVDWTPVSDVPGVTISYEVQVDNDSRFGSPYKANGLNSPPYTVAPDLPGTPGTRYSVRVRAVYDGVVYGPWSKVISFTLDTVNPDIPELVSPVNGVALTNLRPPFRWKTIKGATQYQLQLSTDDTFSNPLSVFVRGGAYTPPGSLLPVTYWWRVQALDAASNESGWGEVRMLTLSSPANAAPIPNRNTAAAPTLTWLPITWAQGYELQIALDTKFKSLVYSNNSIDAVDTSLTVPDELPVGVYYWRMRARQTATIWSKWSSVGIFTIES